MSRCGTGNQEMLCGGMAFGQVVEQHWNAVYRLLYRMSGSSHDAEDLAQETFLRALDRRDSFRPGTNMRAWLMRIASNALFDLQRRRRTAKAAPLEDDLATAPPAETGPSETKELGGLLAAAIAQLPETPRLVFLMRSLEELSFRDIAEAIGTTEETARWHMLQARRQLLALLDGKL
ncbi:MAG: RNA polymerase sigma factor [Planctomycetota bacterium]|nr:RNA polymerase sigma factor [Planctomycetota bacterium]